MEEQTMKVFPIPEWVIREREAKARTAETMIWFQNLLVDFGKLTVLVLQTSTDEESLEIARRTKIEYRDGIPYVAFPPNGIRFPQYGDSAK